MARKTAVTLGVLLAILAALWSLQDGRAATAVHLLLAVGAALEPGLANKAACGGQCRCS
ncbi:MAG: hypothetical protein IPG51_04715 [Chloroflexi bacterium]|nr:hypothetical protein [Chloroflexota bacterium]